MPADDLKISELKQESKNLFCENPHINAIILLISIDLKFINKSLLNKPCYCFIIINYNFIIL